MKNILRQWNKLSEAAKSSIAFMISSFAVKGISFVVTPIFTRIIDSEQYGIIAAYSSWVSIIEVFAVIGLTSAGVFNVGMKEHKEDRDQYISSVLILCNIASIVTFSVLFALKIPFGVDFILPPGLMAAMLIHFLFDPAQIFWITRQRYEYKYKLPFAVTIVSTILSQVVSIICILNITTEEQGALRIWTNCLSMLVVQIPIYIMLLRKGKSFFDLELWKKTLKFALPLIPHYLAQHIMGSSDRIMVKNYYSSTGAAIYSVVANISMITTIIWSAINASLVPYTFDKVENKKGKEVNSIVIPILLFYAVMCLGVTLIAPEVLMILAPKEYYGGIFAVPPIAATAFLAAVYNIYANLEFYHKKTKYIALCTVIAAVTNVVLNFIFIPQYGYVAAAYTTLVSQIILVVMHYGGFKKCHKEDLYNNKAVLIMSVSVICVCMLSNLLYANIYLRYAIVVCVLVCIFIKRKYLLEKYNEIKKK